MAKYSGNEIVITPSPKNEHTGNISKMYRQLSNSNAGTIFDAVNAGLYLAAPFTSGVTLIPAMTMTGILGIGAASDVYEHGWDLNNGIDIASTIPGFKIGEYLVGKSMPWIMKQVGKSTKYAKYFTKYNPTKESIKVGNIELGKSWPTWWQAASENSAYIPGATIVYGEDLLNHGLNIGLVINDLLDTKVESKKIGGYITSNNKNLKIAFGKTGLKTRKSGEKVDTDQCAAFSNGELRSDGYMISGNAWNLNNADIIYSGYKGLEKPQVYTRLAVHKYNEDAANNVLKNFDINTLNKDSAYAVNMYYKGSPSQETAFKEGRDNMTGTHTGYLTFNSIKNRWEVTHNIHGTLVVSPFTSILGSGKKYGITAILAPRKNNLVNNIKRFFGFKAGGQFTFPTNLLVKNQKQLLGNRKRNPGIPKSSRPMYNPNRIINKALLGLKFNMYKDIEHTLLELRDIYIPQLHLDKEDDFTLSTFNTLDEIDTKTLAEPTLIIPLEFIPAPLLNSETNHSKSASMNEKARDVLKSSNKQSHKKYTNKNDFVQDLTLAYLNLGINPQLTKLLVAQSGGESAWGKSTIGNYNFGNIHATNKNGDRIGGWAGDIIFGTDHDANHVKYKVGFRSYNSIEEFARDKWKLLSSSRYGLTKDMNPEEAIDRIVKGGYAEDKKYKEKLKQWFKSI